MAKDVFGKEVIWCSPHRLPVSTYSEGALQISVVQVTTIESLMDYLENKEASSSEVSLVGFRSSASAHTRQALVVLDATENLASCLQVSEKLRMRFSWVEICMFYAQQFEPEKVWAFIVENIKPLFAGPGSDFLRQVSISNKHRQKTSSE